MSSGEVEPRIPEAGPFVSDYHIRRKQELSKQIPARFESDNRLHIFPFDKKEHLASIFRLCSGKAMSWMDSYDPEELIWKWMASNFAPFSDEADFESRYIDRLLSDNDRTLFVLADPRHFDDPLPNEEEGNEQENGENKRRFRLIGMLSLMHNYPAHLDVEVGHIWISPAYQGSYALPLAIYNLGNCIFSLGYRRFTWTCDEKNLRSVQAAKKLGFTYEAKFRAFAFNKEGRERNSMWLSILDNEWGEIEGRDEKDEKIDNNSSSKNVKLVILNLATEKPQEPHKETIFPPKIEPAALLDESVWKRADKLDKNDCYREVSGRFVRLVPFSLENDSEELFLASNGGNGEYDPDLMIWRFLFFPPPLSLADFIETAKKVMEISQPFTIVDKATNQKIGMISICNNVPSCLRAELGNIWITPKFQGGVVLPEITLLLNQVLHDLGYRRIEWKCDARNKRSREAAERMGFNFEGIFRKHFIIKNRSRDTAWFSIAGEEEFNVAKQKLEAIIARRAARMQQ